MHVSIENRNSSELISWNLHYNTYQYNERQFIKNQQTYSTGVSEPLLWNCQHPENWSTAAVREWILFVSDKYDFPETVQARVTAALSEYTGKKLLAMLLPDFRIQFGDVGEIIFTALQQILDVAPQFEGR